jgi:formate dehydrogenase iron-sulfur subunit
MERARSRVDDLKRQGVSGARIYGDETLGGTNGIGDLNAFFILTDEPEVYNLPARPKLPQDETAPGLLSTLGAAVLLGIGLALSFRKR